MHDNTSVVGLSPSTTCPVDITSGLTFKFGISVSEFSGFILMIRAFILRFHILSNNNHQISMKYKSNDYISNIFEFKRQSNIVLGFMPHGMHMIKDFRTTDTE